MLSPQHWAQESTDSKGGTWCATYHDSIRLHWDNKRYRKTVRLSQHNNVTIMKSSPTLSKYSAFMSCFHTLENPTVKECACCCAATSEQTDADTNDILHPITDNIKIDNGDEHIVEVDDMAELVRWHYHLGHLPYPHI